MTKDEKTNTKNMLEFFDQNIQYFQIGSPKIKDISELIKGISLMLAQMKITKETAIKLRERFNGSEEEFKKEALKVLSPKIMEMQKKFEKINFYDFNASLFSLPDKQGREFFEIMADSEEAGKFPVKDPSRREILDKNIQKMESFLEFLKEQQKKFDAEMKNIIKPFNKRQPKILQIKINITGITPRIWRKFLVEDSMTFHQFHNVIQRVMGWENYHLYAFEIGDLRMESEELAEGEYADFEPSEKIRLSQVLKEKMKLEYVYDFGDCWKHRIIVEKVLEKDPKLKYPLCLAGERACPPEDCGSVPGYYDLMNIRQDKNHPEYKERIVEWLGRDYDPEHFDIDEINRILKRKG